ncbi:integrase [Oleomonas cavernae]|uniref:Integrase n=1 Tax=Oleomonas cavernae TaxID=2320859 RepID=A0A418WCK6_9PROT|nr:tyrosine-type recombinase/integrase [Oleomonas cavernae]RJF87706.1 integrase [Oleomonas cavernae]
MDFRGINTVKKRLADGTEKIYYYARKGGPRLRGEPGTVEFENSYFESNRIIEVKKTPVILLDLLNKYQRLPEFKNLKPNTRESYLLQVRRIETKFGSMPVTGKLAAARKAFKRYRAELAEKHPQQADLWWSLLRRVFSVALNEGWIREQPNPCKGGGKFATGSRAQLIWSDAEISTFLSLAPPQFHLALLLALHTGQRQGDLLALRWAAYDDTCLQLVQQKSVSKARQNTEVRLRITVAKALKPALDAARSAAEAADPILLRGPILVNSRGKPWTAYGFRAAWRAAVKRAGIANLRFHDLRGTAVVRLARAGCTVPEICAVTGHSLSHARSILEKHYLGFDSQVGAAAIAKLNRAQRTLKVVPKEAVPIGRARWALVTARDLERMVWSGPLTDLGKEFGISDVAISKRARAVGIPLPGRGFWRKVATGALPHPAGVPADSKTLANRRPTKAA